MKNKILNHIQSLRGLSVFLVFCYHLKLNYFEYGFLGVDIFFVISGYVITSRIYNEFISTNNFNIINFYIKRIKRIYPVLILILSTTFVLIIFFQPLDLFLSSLKVYIFALFGISNLYYLFSKKDYFDTVFDDPYAHTWSLGIEEQFYFIFPLLLFLLLSNINKIKNILIILFILSLIGIISSYIFENDTKLLFYSPLFRFWEFLIGTIAFFTSKKIKYKNNYLSLLVLLFLIIFIISSQDFGSVNILLITIISSSLFILFYEKNKSKFLNLIIENRFFIFFGNISYSFYLWHLPIIYFYDLYFLDNLLRFPLLFLIVISLSYISFNYVENRFRYTRGDFKFSIPKIMILFLTLVTSLLLIIFFAFKDGSQNEIKKSLKNFIYNLNYLEKKINYTERTVFYKFNINNNEIYRYCSSTSKSFKLNSDNLRIECLKKGKNKDRIFFIEGNSHTANFIPMFNTIKIKDSIYFNHKVNPLNEIDFDHIKELKKSYKEIIYTTNINNLEDLNKLTNLKNKSNLDFNILVLGTPPYLNEGLDPLKCFIKNIDCTYNSALDKKRRNLKSLDLKLKKLVNSSEKFIYFDPYYSICPKKICYVFNKEENLLTHRDDSHLTLEGSLLLKQDFEKFYNSNF